MPKIIGNDKVYLHKFGIDVTSMYVAAVNAASEIVAQLGRGNTRIEDMKAFREQVCEKYRQMRHGSKEKERRARAREKARANQSPEQKEKSAKFLAMRNYAERYAIPYKEAKEELTDWWIDHPFPEMPERVTDEQYDNAINTGIEEEQQTLTGEFEPAEPAAPQKTRQQIEYETNMRISREIAEERGEQGWD